LFMTVKKNAKSTKKNAGEQSPTWGNTTVVGPLREVRRSRNKKRKKSKGASRALISEGFKTEWINEGSVEIDSSDGGGGNVGPKKKKRWE